MINISNIKKLFICCVVQQIFSGDQALRDELYSKIVEGNVELRLQYHEPRTVMILNCEQTLYVDPNNSIEMREKLCTFNPNPEDPYFILLFFSSCVADIRLMSRGDSIFCEKPILCLPFLSQASESPVVPNALTEESMLDRVLQENPILRRRNALTSRVLKCLKESFPVSL